MPTRRQEGVQQRLAREGAGVLAGAAAIYLALSLATYAPADPALNAVGARAAANWGGTIGAYLADALLQFTGVVAYVLPLALGVAAWRGLRGERLGFDPVRAGGFAVFVVAGAALAGLVAGHAMRPAGAGGAVGRVLADALRVMFGGVGAYVVVLPILVVAAMFAADRPASPTARRLVEAARALGRLLAAIPGRIAGGVAARRATREAERETAAAAATTALVATRQGKAPIKIPAESIEVLPARRRRKAQQDDTTVPIAPAPEDDATDVTPAAEAPPIKVVERSAEVATLTHPSGGYPAGKGIRKGKRSGEEETTQLLVIDSQDQATKGGFQLPSVSFLDAPAPNPKAAVSREELLANARLLENKLREFGVEGRVTEVHPGPVITMYEYEPAPGVKVNRIVNLADDLAMALKALSVRIVAPLPHKAAVGIEVPNAVREHVGLREILTADSFVKSASTLTFGLGKDTAGVPVSVDLARMPHLLVAGATGSGKSVSVNAMIVSVLLKATPEQARLLMVDPKMLELNVYDGIPHLLLPVVTEPKKAAAAFRWGVMEMERRYRLLADAGVRNIDQYNRNLREGKVQAKPDEEPPRALPYIMIVVDELADLMMVIGREIEESIARLAQKARAAGIHLLLATQRPSVDVITGLIKANFPARIAFQVASKVDSRTILDTNGAEHLLGQGDMLLLPPGSSKLQRIHGAYVSEVEIKRIADFLKAQAEPEYDESILEGADDDEPGLLDDEEVDPKYDEAIQVVAEARMASTSLIQRRLRIGYNRAARMIERMEREGIVGPGDGSKPREVLAGRIGRTGPDRS